MEAWLRMTGKQMIEKDHNILGSSGGRRLQEDQAREIQQDRKN